MDIKIDRLPLHSSIIHFDMAPKVSISVLVVAWVLAAGFVAASESSAALEPEAKLCWRVSNGGVAIPTKAIATGMELSAMMKAAPQRLK